ncbi:hypothetical protein WR25_15784 [Diploscapter pachys]|uniref:Uncharacterized protein n=1 Tax=Diploscapter pachys TaxID=2018661 RepID=A0A2A2JXM6_9BILA|nr:hypothetical protein WR25_15784 [Diploscapter pachys]
MPLRQAVGVEAHLLEGVQNGGVFGVRVNACCQALHGPGTLPHQLRDDPPGILCTVAAILAPCRLHVGGIAHEGEALEDDDLPPLLHGEDRQRRGGRVAPCLQQELGVIKQTEGVRLCSGDALRDLCGREWSRIWLKVHALTALLKFAKLLDHRPGDAVVRIVVAIEAVPLIVVPDLGFFSFRPGELGNRAFDNTEHPQNVCRFLHHLIRRCLALEDAGIFAPERPTVIVDHERLDQLWIKLPIELERFHHFRQHHCDEAFTVRQLHRTLPVVHAGMLGLLPCSSSEMKPITANRAQRSPATIPQRQLLPPRSSGFAHQVLGIEAVRKVDRMDVPVIFPSPDGARGAVETVGMMDNRDRSLALDVDQGVTK